MLEYKHREEVFDYMNIGEVIKTFRQRQNITQEELANRLNITAQAVSRWETGISYPDITMIPHITQALHITSDELFGIDTLNQSQVDSMFDYIPTGERVRNKRIAIADDSPFIRTVVADILSPYGHAVSHARDGIELLELLEKKRMDYVLLDISMPNMDGIETLAKVKEYYPDTKVIMLSARSQTTTVIESINYGADGFIVKPFQENSLLDRII